MKKERIVYFETGEIIIFGENVSRAERRRIIKKTCDNDIAMFGIPRPRYRFAREWGKDSRSCFRWQ